MSNLIKRNNQPVAIEKVSESNGNVASLTAVERKLYYLEMCRAYQFDPRSFPFDYIESDAKLKLYINSVGASQLRDRFEISTRIKSREFLEDMWIVTVEASKGDRTEEATGAASILDKYGKTTPERKANALKKAETQARRRATLAICGFGWDDEESGTIIHASVYDPPEDVILTPLPPTNEEAWRNWQGVEDAIAWAKSQLPKMTDEQLREILNATQPDPQTGKKALAFYQRVQAMNEF